MAEEDISFFENKKKELQKELDAIDNELEKYKDINFQEIHDGEDIESVIYKGKTKERNSLVNRRGETFHLLVENNKILEALKLRK